MVLNSCVGSQVRAPLLHPLSCTSSKSPALAMQVLNLLLGVGLPCFVSAAMSGHGGSLQVREFLRSLLLFEISH